MIEIEFNDDELDPALARIAAALADPSDLMKDLGELLPASTQDRIERGAQPDGRARAPRPPVTPAQYAARGLKFGKPLDRSGGMRQGIHYEAGPDCVRIGSNAMSTPRDFGLFFRATLRYPAGMTRPAALRALRRA